jgi:hypothetical protein
VSSADLFKQFEVKADAAVILLKKFDEGRNNLEGKFTYVIIFKKKKIETYVINMVQYIVYFILRCRNVYNKTFVKTCH